MSSSRPSVAICLATYQPRADALQRQLDSVRAQSHTDWHCWVVDDGSDASSHRALSAALEGDERFTLVRFQDNVGFYRNFERGLALVRGQAPWVALCDQDDVWAPDKIETLLAEITASSGCALVYSDVEVRAEDGTLIAPTYWVGRQHNERDLAALLFANTVTGAASVFAEDLLDAALPFPTAFPSSFHDHWLALVARTGSPTAVRYVDRPLHTYVQHPGNAIGHQPARHEGALRLLARTLGRAWWRRPEQRYYDDEVARLADMAAALLTRSPSLSPDDRRVLRAAASLHDRRPAWWWLVLQAAREARDPSVTMWRRRRVLVSVLWTCLTRQLRRRASTSSS